MGGQVEARGIDEGRVQQRDPAAADEKVKRPARPHLARPCRGAGDVGMSPLPAQQAQRPAADQGDADAARQAHPGGEHLGDVHQDGADDAADIGQDKAVHGQVPSWGGGAGSIREVRVPAAAVWRPPASCRMQPGSGLGAGCGGAAWALRSALALRAASALRAAGAGGLLGGLLAAAGAAGTGTDGAVAGDLLEGVHGGVPWGGIDDGVSSMAGLSALHRRTHSPMRRTVGTRPGAVSPIDRVVAPSPRAVLLSAHAAPGAGIDRSSACSDPCRIDFDG